MALGVGVAGEAGEAESVVVVVIVMVMVVVVVAAGAAARACSTTSCLVDIASLSVASVRYSRVVCIPADTPCRYSLGQTASTP